MNDGPETVLFIDDDGSLARRAVEDLEDRHGDTYQGRAAAVDPDGDVTPASDVDTSSIKHVVTLTAGAKAGCPPVSPGTHYMHWPVAGADDLGDRIDRGFGGKTTFTPSGDLPWGEEE